MNKFRLLPALGYILALIVFVVWGEDLGVPSENRVILAFFIGFGGVIAIISIYLFTAGYREA